MTRLDSKAMGLGFALLLGLGLFLGTWWVILFQGVTYDSTVIGLFFRGYSISPVGSIAGLFWGLLGGFIAGLVFAWFYNTFAEARAEIHQGEADR